MVANLVGESKDKTNKKYYNHAEKCIISLDLCQIWHYYKNINQYGVNSMNYSDILSNPSRMRIMEYMSIHGEATAKEIAGYLNDIPRRSLYRHIDFLIDAGAISIKEERKVRGGVERLLKDNTEEFVKSKDLSDSAYAYFMDLFTKFDRYNKEHHKNIHKDFEKDMLCFGTSIFYLDDKEMKEFLDEMNKIALKYENAHKEKYGKEIKGKLRSVSFISAPLDQ